MNGSAPDITRLASSTDRENLLCAPFSPDRTEIVAGDDKDVYVWHIR